MKRLLIVALMVVIASVARSEPQVYVVPSLAGDIPPSIHCPFTFPLEMSDVDSISVRFIGEFVEGVGVTWGNPEPRAMPHRPDVAAYINECLWKAYVPMTLESGPMDVVVRFEAAEEVDISEIAGVTTDIWVGIHWSTLWQPIELPSATIDSLELWLWTGESTAVESSTWSSMKALFE